MGCPLSIPTNHLFLQGSETSAKEQQKQQQHKNIASSSSSSHTPPLTELQKQHIRALKLAALLEERKRLHFILRCRALQSNSRYEIAQWETQKAVRDCRGEGDLNTWRGNGLYWTWRGKEEVVGEFRLSRERVRARVRGVELEMWRLRERRED